MQNVLIVDCDEQSLRRRGDQLLLDGYEVSAAGSERAARLKLAEGPDALVLCEAGTPASTLKLLRQLRRGEVAGADPTLPVLSVGADDDSAAVRHYRAGADIALPQAASPLLTAAGLEALAARAGGERARRRILRAGSVSIDCDARVVKVGDQRVYLSRLELDLLQALAAEPRRVMTKAELSREVWGFDPAVAPASRTVDSHASRLRQKLQAAGSEPLVQAVRGVGYRLTN